MKPKKLWLLIVSWIIFSSATIAQGVDCSSADPFCTGTTYNFPNSTSTTAQSGPDYGCLATQPNPAWYFLQIDQSGDLILDISQTTSAGSGIDVDFICWGPFPDPTSPCTSLLTSGNEVDCSYSIAAVETCTIPNAITGEYYLVLITNYSGQSGTISLSQSGGVGTTDCTVLCDMTGLTANPGACDPATDTYTLSGTVTYLDAPTTGQLIVEDCNGNQQVFNPPFGTSQSYSLTGLPATGAGCDVTAYFTDATLCTMTTAFTEPQPCSVTPTCQADAGSVTVTLNGSGTNNYVLCVGDEIDIQTNNDFTDPLNSGTVSGNTFSPGLGFAIYTCPPTAGLEPNADPCFSGFYTGTLNSFTETNTSGSLGGTLASIIGGGATVTNNTFYIVPITLYNGANQFYDPNCYDLGTAIPITYLEPIDITGTEICATTSVDVVISGGYPEFFASNYVLSNLQPATASLSATTLSSSGGTVSITGLNQGDNYSFDLTDGNGCVSTFTGGPFSGLNVTISDTTICEGGTASLTATPLGGTAPFTYVWDNSAVTQTINVNPSSAQTFCVVVTDSDGCISLSTCANVDLYPPLDITVLSDQAICEGDPANISASATGGDGGPYNFVWDQGIGAGDSQTVSPSTTTTYTCTVTDGCETPSQSGTATITVHTAPTVTFTGDVLQGCAPVSVNFTEDNLPAGATCSWDFGDGGTSSSMSPSYDFNIPGCWDVTLNITTQEGCQSQTVMPSYVCVAGYPIVNFDWQPNPTTIFNPTITFNNLTTGAVSYDWEFDVEGVITNDNSVNPVYTFPDQLPGTYNVCLTATSAEQCESQLCQPVTIYDEILVFVPNAFTPDGDPHNEEFVPVTAGIKEDTYEFYVFNKWGQLIFFSETPGEAWDGTYKGLPVEQDIYIWKVEVKAAADNGHHELTGHVSLLR